MTAVERYCRFMNFETVDHPPMILPGGIFPVTRRRGEQEGLPRGANLNEYFGAESLPVRPVAIDTLLSPAFEEKILEEIPEFVEFMRCGSSFMTAGEVADDNA